MSRTPTVAYVLVFDGLEDLPSVLLQIFQHPWVATYQVGFGPPLVRSSKRLVEGLKNTASVLDRLEVYLRTCYLDSGERSRLATLLERQVVRRMGPAEAEDIDRASAEALHLELRLHSVETAPPPVSVEMKKAGATQSETAPLVEHIERDVALAQRGVVASDEGGAAPGARGNASQVASAETATSIGPAVGGEVIASEVPFPPAGNVPNAPESLGRISIPLLDPRNTRLLTDDERLREAAALDLRVLPGQDLLWLAWLEDLTSSSRVRYRRLGDPLPHAMVSRDGFKM